MSRSPTTRSGSARRRPRKATFASMRFSSAAQRTGAEAIHPGYGFLSENPAFARACADAGITFVGPPAEAIEAMGAKDRAKALMAEAGVPLVPGYDGASQDPDALLDAARALGFPVLIKAAAGGGGRGMRVVAEPGGFADALAGARREAASAFGNDRVLLERYLARPRHIEAQIFGDRHGRIVHLFERDCSAQRRHQKVIEEAPAPGLSRAQRSALAQHAIRAGQAIGYVNAGTVEFLMEDAGFYFIEMNTRLQVEHPVTEMVTGQDLVEWQLRVAAGEPLPLGEDEIAVRGHAIEARIYAEDPARGFLPSTGRLEHLRFPAEGDELRIETGVVEGDAVSPFYDADAGQGRRAWRRSRGRLAAAAHGARGNAGRRAHDQYRFPAADRERSGLCRRRHRHGPPRACAGEPAGPRARRRPSVRHRLPLAPLPAARAARRCGEAEPRSVLSLASGRRLAA